MQKRASRARAVAPRISVRKSASSATAAVAGNGDGHHAEHDGQGVAPRLLAPSVSETAYATLRDAIVACELAPGARLTESEVAERIALGKTPVREALRRLVQEGLVLVRPRQSYVVAPITPADVEDLCGLRLIVEPAAVALAAGRLDAADVAQLERLCHVGFDVSDPASVRAFHHANRTFHSTISQASGNARLAALVDQLLVELERMIQFGMLVNPRSSSAVTVHRHEALVRALRRGKAEQARLLVEREIRGTRRMVTEALARSASAGATANR